MNIVLAALAGIFLFLAAQPAGADQAGQAYRRLNELRARSGLINLIVDQRLERAAAAHAGYLIRRRASGHIEIRGRAGFTGRRPLDRMLAAGWRNRFGIENVYVGPHDPAETVDQLFTGVYHRFAFLDFRITAVGAAVRSRPGRQGRIRAAVFNMGAHLMDQLCRRPPAVTGRYLTGVCQPERRIPEAAFNAARSRPRQANPRLVVWPADGSTDVPPVFFEENPDPLPDRSVSGYPISIQFNTDKEPQARLISLRLFRAADGAEVGPCRLLGPGNDPNRAMNQGEYALFPLDRLDWATQYRAQADLDSGRGREKLTWQFTTLDPGADWYKLTGAGELVAIPNGGRAALYFPPTADHPLLGRIKFSTPTTMNLAVKQVDLNTVIVSVKGPAGTEARLTMPGRRTVRIVIK